MCMYRQRNDQGNRMHPINRLYTSEWKPTYTTALAAAVYCIHTFRHNQIRGRDSKQPQPREKTISGSAKGRGIPRPKSMLVIDDNCTYDLRKAVFSSRRQYTEWYIADLILVDYYRIFAM
jgi:hypothetical protein